MELIAIIFAFYLFGFWGGIGFIAAYIIGYLALAIFTSLIK
jgi:hypothetical protein